MSAVATAAQVQALQIARRRAGISNEDWAARLQREAGVTSTKLVPYVIARKILDDFNGGSRTAPSNVEGARDLTGPYAGKLRALWLTGYNLGVVKVKTDAALLAFVERQTGIENTRFLREADKAKRAIEGLKGWIARDAKFEWPSDGDIVGTKIAVVRHQWAMLIAAGAVRIFRDAEIDLGSYAGTVCRGSSNVVNSVEWLTDAELDVLAKALGAKLRKALAK